VLNWAMLQWDFRSCPKNTMKLIRKREKWKNTLKSYKNPIRIFESSTKLWKDKSGTWMMSWRSKMLNLKSSVFSKTRRVYPSYFDLTNKDKTSTIRTFLDWRIMLPTLKLRLIDSNPIWFNKHKCDNVIKISTISLV